MEKSRLSAAVLASAFVLYFLWSALDKLRHRAVARRLGCQPAYTRPSKLPLGIDNVARMFFAIRDKVLQNDDIVVYEAMGCPSTWVQNILGTWYHTTVDPENIKAILATQFKDFDLGDVRYGTLGPLLGPGIFTTDGEQWQHHRALLRPQFTRSQISNLDLEEIHVQNLFDRFGKSNESPWTAPVDLAPLFFNLTLDSATEFLFGQSVQSQVQKKEGMQKDGHGAKFSKNGGGGADWSFFGSAFDRANTVIAMKSAFMDLHALYAPRSFRRDCETVHQFADYWVQQALSEESKTGESDEKGESYIFLHELAKTTKDAYALRSQLLNILLAGRDTTAGLLGWTFYLLARHPEHYSKLHNVIVETFGPYSADASSLTFESLKSCQPLQYLLSEVLRLHPVVPENSRRAIKDTTLPRGGGPDGQSPIYIRKGEEVMYSVNIMHRRKDLWGEDANEFRPERWAGRRHSWDFLPFNGGPRICLGQQFALTEAAFVVARILQRYSKIENLDTDAITRHQYTLTTAPVKVLVKLYEAAHA